MIRRKRITLLAAVLVLVVALDICLWTRPEIKEDSHWYGRYRFEVRKINGVERAHGKLESWWRSGNRHVVAQCENSPIPEQFFMMGSMHPDFLFDGGYTEWHENGQKAVMGEYKSGKKVGVWTYYHKNGQRHSVGNYWNNQQHGPWVRWNPEGKVLGTNMFDKGTGAFVDWHPNGTKRIICHFQEGQLHGELTQWYADGGLQFHAFFIDGKRHGHFSHVRTNEVVWQATYSNGVKTSETQDLANKEPEATR